MAFLWKLIGPGQQIFDVSIVLPKHFIVMLLHDGQNVPDIEVRPEAVRFCGFYQAIDSCTGLGSVDRSIMTQFFLLCSTAHNRKNWLFAVVPSGAEASALIYTMVEMARANGVNVYQYLTYLLEKCPTSQTSDEELEKLAPWDPEVKRITGERSEALRTE